MVLALTRRARCLTLLSPTHYPILTMPSPALRELDKAYVRLYLTVDVCGQPRVIAGVFFELHLGVTVCGAGWSHFPSTH